MGDEINKKFEEFQEELKIKEKRLKKKVKFETDEELEKAIEELKNKEVVF